MQMARKKKLKGLSYAQARAQADADERKLYGLDNPDTGEDVRFFSPAQQRVLQLAPEGFKSKRDEELGRQQWEEEQGMTVVNTPEGGTKAGYTPKERAALFNEQMKKKRKQMQKAGSKVKALKYYSEQLSGE